VPPDGAICGLIAAREHRRQAWVAPANLPLNEVLGLQTNFSNDDWALLFAQRFNLIRPEAGDFRPMSAHTLSGDRSLMQISVRRLLILLRKAAVQLGMDFVFESNHEIFREGMRVVLEDMLRFLYERGAFAGRTAEESFRVITDASVNPPQSVEQGRFIAVIQVAPSQPMEFITVQLTRRGEGDLFAKED
jgi:phage tail sheath protein FI